ALRLGHCYAGLQPRDCAILEIVRLVLLFIGSKTHRDPHVAMAQTSRIEWEFKAARHDADDGVRTAVQINSHPNRFWIGLKSLAPKCIADDRDGSRVLVFVLRKGAPHHRLYPEHR